MDGICHHYFKNDNAWRNWLHENHSKEEGIYLIFYKITHENESMRWEEAVRVALCYGWIDSTVKSLGQGKRQQYFCPRKPKSTWSKLNKTHIQELIEHGLMHESGMKKIEAAQKDGSWSLLDDVENGIIPEELNKAFKKNPMAFINFENFTRSQQKSFLYWLKQAKRHETREKRIAEIIRLCKANKKLGQ